MQTKNLIIVLFFLVTAAAMGFAYYYVSQEGAISDGDTNQLRYKTKVALSANLNRFNLASRNTANRSDLLDRAIDSLNVGNATFKAPKSVSADTSFQIHLSLNVDQSIKQLKAYIRQQNNNASNSAIKISDRIQARLTGPNFEIAALTPKIQVISSTRSTDWMWHLKPKQDGRHTFYLTLSAYVTIDGISTARTIQTFSHEIRIRYDWKQQIKDIFLSNMDWLWATVFLPLVGLLWNRKGRNEPTRRNRTKSESRRSPSPQTFEQAPDQGLKRRSDLPPIVDTDETIRIRR